MCLLKYYFGILLIILLKLSYLQANGFDELGQDHLLEKRIAESIQKANYIQLCGIGKSKRNEFLNLTRIVGGEEAGQHQYPWHVSLQVRAGNRPLRHLCGGSIIGGSWIITAAHCTKAYGVQNMIVIAGAHNLKRRERFHRQIRQVRKVYEHTGYNPLTQVNDISLIKTNKPFRFDVPGVAPACLPNSNQEFHGKCLITGWGRTEEHNSKFSDVLQRALVPLITDQECRRRFKVKGHFVTIHNTMLCAGLLSGGADACQGDSGGPLVCPGKTSLPMVTGIVSWGIGCGNEGIPGVYTQVSKYVSWITRLVNTEPPVRRNQFSPSRPFNGIKNSDIFSHLDSGQRSGEYSSEESMEILASDSSESFN